MRGLLHLTIPLALAAACASPSSPDAGPTPDATARLDATAFPDARADAAPADMDAGVHPDATETLDATQPDATSPDASLPDASDPCGPLPRIDGRARFTGALTQWLARCNPELSASEALAAALVITDTASISSAFSGLATSYDETNAGACACAIEAAPCDNFAAFRALASCDAAFVGTATTGDPCLNDFDCPSAHACRSPGRAVATVAGATPIGPSICDEPPICMRLLDVDDDCDNDQGICRPGTYCEFTKGGATCVASAALGEDCSNRPCIGDYADVFVFPPNECVFTKAGSDCRARGRGMGGTCDQGGSCHDLYRCQDDGTCLLAPGDGESCMTPYDVAMPTYDQQAELINAASDTCRLPSFPGLLTGFWCTQTGTTTGQATCQPLPQRGQPCGIGPGLAAACGGDTFCDGIDEYTLAPIAATCRSRLAESATCTPSLFEINDPCALGYACYFDGESTPYCANVCSGLAVR